MYQMILKSIVVLSLALSTQSWARQTHHVVQNQTEQSNSENSWGDGEHYHSRDGSLVHRPSRNNDSSERITAQCRDGTHSYSHSHRGTCSHHGGVAEWK